MKTITLKNISMSYQNQDLFAGVSFSVKKGDRIAITGKNGAGKSTLLKIIAGLETCDSGTVVRDNVSCAYIAQEFVDNPNLSILEYLESRQASSKVFELIKQFGILPEAHIENGYLYELSGGQQRILEIAVTLSQSPMFLCIDEPENHLDIKARLVLTTILKEYWGAVLFVSHDRHLVNEIATKILAVQNQQATLMSDVSYEEFQRAEQQKLVSGVAHWKSEARALDKLEDSVRMLKARTRYTDTQARTYQMKKRELEARRQELGKRPDQAKAVQIQMESVRKKTGKLIFSCADVWFGYETNVPVLKEITVELRFGQRVVLLGRNGSGKSTLLKLLKQDLQPQSGEVRVGADIQLQYVDQSSTLDTNLSPLEHFYASGFTEERARSVLDRFLFEQSTVTMALKTLSGGQQQRFTFLFLFMTNPEALVLDEPHQ